MNGTNGNEPGYPENALVPYPVIVAATKLCRFTGLECRTSTIPKFALLKPQVDESLVFENDRYGCEVLIRRRNPA